MTTNCKSCELLNGLVQCNECRKNNPNQQTLTRRRIIQMMSEGMTVAEAEKALGVTGRVINA